MATNCLVYVNISNIVYIDLIIFYKFYIVHRSLRFKGLYNRVRLVLDMKDCYYIAGEYMDCNGCKGTLISWDSRILAQLPLALKTRFPAVMTHKFGCDISVVTLLWARTNGNTPFALSNNVKEVHSEEWCRRLLWYLSDCDRHRQGLQRFSMQTLVYQAALQFRCVPNYKWFLACYIRDVWDRLPLLKAAVTSVYGSVLKIDSTKKVHTRIFKDMVEY